MGVRPTFRLRAMHVQNRALAGLLEPVIAALGYELWGLELLGRGSRPLLRVYIDAEAGITLADCERVSHQITGTLDVEDPIRGPYDLEVSSPGLDRPLFNLAQFERFLGCEVRLRLKAKVSGRRNLAGKIKGVSEELITLGCEDETIVVPVDLIEKARLVPQV